MVERNSDTLGRTAQYKKVSALATIPESTAAGLVKSRSLGRARDAIARWWASLVFVRGALGRNMEDVSCKL